MICKRFMLEITRYCSTPDWDYWYMLKDIGEKCLQYSILHREVLELQFYNMKHDGKVVGESMDPANIKSTWTM